MPLSENFFDSRAQLDQALAQEVQELIRESISKRGGAVLAVSGGSTPTNLYSVLSKADLDWSKVTIVLVDERWVAADHADSNEKLVREKLLINNAAAASFIGLKTSVGDAFEEQDQVERNLAKLPGLLTVVLLGMGEDGHTASFFPGTEQLSQALDMDSGKRCQAILPKEAPHPRMTLTLPRLLSSRHVFLHITGDKKREVYQKAMEKGEIENLPVRAILHQDAVPVDVYWAP